MISEQLVETFRGRILTHHVFDRPIGLKVALVRLMLEDDIGLLDLDDPQQLAARRLVPSRVASSHRQTTQDIVRRLYDEGLPGFTWWSTLDSSWKNATLFESRVKRSLQVADDITALHVELPEVRQAAKDLHIGLRGKKR